MTSEVVQLAPYAGEFSARAAQITRNVDRYEAAWRTEHPGEEPGRKLRQGWDRRAWSQARPDKVIPADGEALELRWVEELLELGFVPPTPAPTLPAISTAPAGRSGWTVPLGVPIGRLDRDAAAELMLARVGARRSAWNPADLRGEAEKIIAGLDIITTTPVRAELAEDLVARATGLCVPLLPERDDVPTHVRSLTSPHVVAVEDELVARLAARGRQLLTPVRDVDQFVEGYDLDTGQAQVVAVALDQDAKLIVVEGAAGAGKTTTLGAIRDTLSTWWGLTPESRSRLVVATPTLKAAQVAAGEVGVEAFSAAWLVHQHGFRWDTDGAWTRVPTAIIDKRARLTKRDLLFIDEAGMLDQDTALALLTVADEAGARVAFAGDRHQLPAVGRGGVLDHAARWAQPEELVKFSV